MLPNFFTSHFVKNNNFFMENSRKFYSWRSALQYDEFLSDIIWLKCRTICNLKAYEKCYLIAISYLPILPKWNSQCPSKNVKFSIFWEIFYCHFDPFDKKTKIRIHLIIKTEPVDIFEWGFLHLVPNFIYFLKIHILLGSESSQKWINSTPGPSVPPSKIFENAIRGGS